MRPERGMGWVMAPRIVFLAALVAALAVSVSGSFSSTASAAGVAGGVSSERVVAVPVDYCGNDTIDVPDRTPFFDFASACQAHDQCYDQNNTPSGHAACDEQFLVAMRASCDQMWPVSGPWDFFQLRNRRTCYSYAQLYYLGVRIGGLLYLRYPNPV